MIKAIFVDDNITFFAYFSEVIQKLSLEMGLDFHLDVITEPLKLLDMIECYDVYFFNIEMSKISGIELAYELRCRYNDKEFIFVSSYEQYARASIKAKPSAFVRKFYLENDLREAFLCLNKLFALKETEVILKNNLKDYPVQISEIMYICSEEHYLHLTYIDETKSMIRNSMKIVTEQLRKYDFLRVNHGCLINLIHVKDFVRKSVIMKNEFKVNVTDTYFKDAVIILRNWLMKGK